MAIKLTRSQLQSLRPCALERRIALYGRRRSLTASQALAAGASVHDILWVAGKLKLKLKAECVTFSVRAACPRSAQRRRPPLHSRGRGVARQPVRGDAGARSGNGGKGADIGQRGLDRMASGDGCGFHQGFPGRGSRSYPSRTFREGGLGVGRRRGVQGPGARPLRAIRLVAS